MLLKQMAQEFALAVTVFEAIDGDDDVFLLKAGVLCRGMFSKLADVGDGER